MIEKIELGIKGFDDLDFEDDCNKILEISKQLEETTNVFINGTKVKTIQDDLDIVFQNINQVLYKWTTRTYVGQRKEKQLEEAFQIFYDKLYYFLIHGQYYCSLIQELAKKILYKKGTLYRILGHSTSNKCNVQIEPEYNNIWVSWSKENVKDNYYLNSKLYGVKTLLITKVDSKFGIDLTGWDDFFGTNIVRPNESEVVYPTLKDNIIDVQKYK